MNTKTQIPSFRGQYKFLSNFWPCSVTLDGIQYPSAEHAYMSFKSSDPAWKKLCQDPKISAAFIKSSSKALQMHESWDKIKVDIMRRVLKAKFTQNNHLRGWLLATGDNVLEEGNTWGDTFWGICKGKGQNHLGKLLMEIRKGLK